VLEPQCIQESSGCREHREDNKNDVDQPGWKKEQRGYAAEVSILEKRLSELEAKKKMAA
jgi:hypothetical protein